MEEQEWRKHARRHAPSRAVQAPHSATSPRVASASARLSNATVASANRSVLRKNEPSKAPSNGPPPSSSRWKDMRQAVRIKATLDTDERHRRAPEARIADLCDEDRDKVAKLVRRIVEVGALHEQSETEFARQRALLESEVQELRDHAKRDARELDELSAQLQAALAKVRDYQDRVLVLEESNELEVRHRMETDQTVDQLKLEVDKLRKLVKRQKLEMERQQSEQKRHHAEEMEQMAAQVRDSHELLLRERRERLEEKQKELEDRIQRTASASASDGGVATTTANKYDPPRATTQETTASAERVSLPLDVASFLNTSGDLPEKIKEIMNEWKQRMEDALNTTAASIAETRPVHVAPRMVSTGIQTDSARSTGESGGAQRDKASQRQSPRSNQRVPRPDFDRLLVRESDGRRSRDSSSRGSSEVEGSISRPSRSSISPRIHNGLRDQMPPRLHTSPTHERSVTRALLDDFANTSVLMDADSFEDEVESTIALIDGLESPSPQACNAVRETRHAIPPRKLSLFDSSVLEIVDAMDRSETGSSPPSRHREEESPTTRVERLLEGLRVREQKLARVSARPPTRLQEPSFLQDVDLFNEVKDVYEADLQYGRRGANESHNPDLGSYELAYDDDDDHTSDPLGSSHSSRGLTVREAIEQDMQELLRQESFLAHRT